MTEPSGRNTDERESFGPGGLPPRDPSELIDAGPALRIRERTHPAGPAFVAQWGWGTPDILGPDDGPDPAPERLRREGRLDLRLGAVGAAVLLAIAGLSFLSSGGERGDTLLNVLGFACFVGAVLAFAGGSYLARRA